MPDAPVRVLAVARRALVRPMLLRGGDQVLTADQVREMGRDHLTTGQRESGTAFLGAHGWGLGTSVVLDGPWTGAFGWDGGLGSSFLVHRSGTSP